MSLTFYDKKNPLIETCEFVPDVILHEAVTAGPGLVVNEDASAPKRMVLEGVFQRSDVKNLNKRVYPKKVWERLCNESSPMMKRVRERAMIGHLEHPKDGVTSLEQGAILVTDIKLMEDGTVRGKVLVYNTPAGQIVQEYIATKTKIGISSRGTGSVDSNGVVQEDYNCDTWDMVYNPSTPGAHPSPTNESEEKNVSESEKNKKVDEAHSVEQILLSSGGPDWVSKKTGLSGNDLAMVFGRFLTFVTQRGAAFHELEGVWTEFTKFYPEVGKAKDSAAGDHGAPPSEPAKKIDPPSNEVPAIKQMPTEGEQPSGENKDKKVDEPAKDAPAAGKLDEQGIALLAEAKASITRLEGELAASKAEIATVNESLKKVSSELETSVATVASVTEARDRLQAEVAKYSERIAAYESTLAALTAVDVAAQVRNAVESVIKADPRLAVFREVLEAQKTPAAVEARAQKALETLHESTGKKSTPAAPKGQPTLEERIRLRTASATDKNLPPRRVVSEADAGHVEERAPIVQESGMASKQAKAVAGALKRGIFK